MESGSDSEDAAKEQTRKTELGGRWVMLVLLLLIIVIGFIDRRALSLRAFMLREVFQVFNAAYGRTGIAADHFSYKPVSILIAFMPLAGTVALFVLGGGFRDFGVASS